MDSMVDNTVGPKSGLTVSITNPNAPQIDTTDTTISLVGTATSDTAIESISWTNDRGGSGIASSTVNWATSSTATWQAGNISLELGSNTIVISAIDVDGKVSTDTLTVNRETTGSGSATLSWIPPTQRTDSTPLTDLAGYRIYYGRMSKTYDYQIDVDNPGVVTYVVENLVSGDWYFALSAYDSQGLESDRSNEVLRNIS
jgi:hypothetical protein